MKKLVLLLSCFLSVTSYAEIKLNAFQVTSLVPLASTAGTTAATQNQRREHAKEILADANEYLQGDGLSVKLAEHVRNIKSQEEMSTAEAVDVLIEIANQVLAE